MLGVMSRGIWSMIRFRTTHSFVPYLPGGNHGETDEAPAAVAGGACAEGDCRPLEGDHSLPPLRWREAALRVEALGAEREPEGAHPAAARDGGARPRPPR